MNICPFAPTLGPRFVSVYPIRMWLDHLGSCAEVDLRLPKVEAIGGNCTSRRSQYPTFCHRIGHKVIDDINKGSRGNYRAIISDIRLQATLFQCNFTLKGRASNTDAHSLAKFSLSKLRRHVWLGQYGCT